MRVERITSTITRAKVASETEGVAEGAETDVAVDVSQGGPGAPADEAGDDRPEGEVPGSLTTLVGLEWILRQAEGAGHPVEEPSDGVEDTAGQLGDRRPA